MDNENVTVHSHRYLPTRDPAHPPFTLNLIGQDEGKIQFPPELIDEEEGSEPIIVRHSDKSYSEFYNIIGTMVRPSWSPWARIDKTGHDPTCLSE